MDKIISDYDTELEKIQSIQHNILHYQQKMAILALRNLSCQIIQMFMRSVLAKNKLKKLKSNRFLSIWIWFRVWCKRRRRAELTISYFMLSKLSVYKYRKMLIKHRAASTLARCCKKFLAMKKLTYCLKLFKKANEIRKHVIFFGLSRATTRILTGRDNLLLPKLSAGNVFLSVYKRRRRIKMLLGPAGKVCLNLLFKLHPNEDDYQDTNFIMEFIKQKDEIESGTSCTLRESHPNKSAAIKNKGTVATTQNKSVKGKGNQVTNAVNHPVSHDLHDNTSVESNHNHLDDHSKTKREASTSYNQHQIIEQLPNEFKGFYKPRTFADIVLMFLDLKRVALDRPHYIDEKYFTRRGTRFYTGLGYTLAHTPSTSTLSSDGTSHGVNNNLNSKGFAANKYRPPAAIAKNNSYGSNRSVSLVQPPLVKTNSRDTGRQSVSRESVQQSDGGQEVPNDGPSILEGIPSNEVSNSQDKNDLMRHGGKSKAVDVTNKAASTPTHHGQRHASNASHFALSPHNQTKVTAPQTTQSPRHHSQSHKHHVVHIPPHHPTVSHQSESIHHSNHQILPQSHQNLPHMHHNLPPQTQHNLPQTHQNPPESLPIPIEKPHQPLPTTIVNPSGEHERKIVSVTKLDVTKLILTSKHRLEKMKHSEEKVHDKRLKSESLNENVNSNEKFLIPQPPADIRPSNQNGRDFAKRSTSKDKKSDNPEDIPLASLSSDQNHSMTSSHSSTSTKEKPPVNRRKSFIAGSVNLLVPKPKVNQANATKSADGELQASNDTPTKQSSTHSNISSSDHVPHSNPSHQMISPNTVSNSSDGMNISSRVGSSRIGSRRGSAVLSSRSGGAPNEMMPADVNELLVMIAKSDKMRSQTNSRQGMENQNVPSSLPIIDHDNTEALQSEVKTLTTNMELNVEKMQEGLIESKNLRDLLGDYNYSAESFDSYQSDTIIIG